MAQIYGIIWFDKVEECDRSLESMGKALRRPTQAPPLTWSLPRVGLGAVLSREAGAFSIVPAAQGPIVVAVDGNPSYKQAPATTERLAELYRQEGQEFVRQLQGSFAIALYDSVLQKLLLATDRLLTRFLYWTRLSGGLVFSSELKGLLGIPSLRMELDPQAVACYLRYGRLFGRRTLCQGVQPGLPGTTVECDLARGTITELVHTRLESIVLEREPLDDSRKQRLNESFRKAVVRDSPKAERVGLSLSGGLDSRTILAVLSETHLPAVLRTEGLPGCMDERVGAKLASLTNLPWDFQPLREAQISHYLSAIYRYVYLTEGMMVPEGYPGLGPAQFALEMQLPVLLRGHGGENARLGDAWPFQVKREVLELPRSDLARVLESENGHHVHPDHLSLFQDEGIQQSLNHPEDTFENYARTIDSDLSAAETLSLMYLRINDGGQVSSFRNCLRGYADIGLPFLDDEFLSLVLATRVEDRRDEAIQYYIIQKNCPPLMRVPNSNNGAPLDASWFRRALTEKLHGLFRKLRLPGFRHYHYVERWMRHQLLASVRNFVLGEATASRGLFNRSHVVRLLEEPRLAGRPRLLARLVMIETWLRLFVDREAIGYKLKMQNEY